MSKVSTNIALDPSLKKSAQELFYDLGMDMTTAITLFLKQAVREQGIPFAITKSVYNRDTKEALAEYEAMHKNPGNYKRYNDFSELLAEVTNEP